MSLLDDINKRRNSQSEENTQGSQTSRQKRGKSLLDDIMSRRQEQEYDDSQQAEYSSPLDLYNSMEAYQRAQVSNYLKNYARYEANAFDRAAWSLLDGYTLTRKPDENDPLYQAALAMSNNQNGAAGAALLGIQGLAATQKKEEPVPRQTGFGYGDTALSADEGRELMQGYKNYLASLTQPQQGQTVGDMLGKKSWLGNSPYAEYMSREDYADKSKAGESKRRFFGGDELYDYINNIGDEREKADSAMQRGTGAMDYGKYAYMTEDEVGVYNYIYATEGKKAANKYLKDLEPELNRQDYTARSKANQERAAEHPWLYGLATVAGQPVRMASSMLAGAQDAARIATDREIDPYSPLRQASLMTSDVRQAAGENAEWAANMVRYGPEIAEAETNYDLYSKSGKPNPFESVRNMDDETAKKVGSFVYQTIMSAADSTVNMAMASGLASGYGALRGIDLSTKAGTEALMQATNVIGSLTMSSEVMSLGIAEAKEKGYSDAGAWTLGLVRGAIEYASEAVGGEWVIKNIKANPLNFVKSMLLNMIPEGVEEVMSDVGNGAVNMLVDALFGTEESGIPQLIRYFSQEGWKDENPVISGIMSLLGEENNPELAAVLYLLGEEGLSFLGGALATVGSSGVQTVNFNRGVSAVSNRLGTTREGAVQLMQDYQTESPGELYEMAQRLDAENEEQFRQKAGEGREAADILEETRKADEANKDKFQSLSDTFRQSGFPLSNHEVRALTNSMDAGDTDPDTFRQGALMAYKMGASGNFTLSEAIRATDFSAKMTEAQFRQAFELGQARAGDKANATSTSTAEKLDAALAVLGDNSALAANAYEEGQDIDSYAAAMYKAAALYAANGQDLQAIVEQARNGERADIVGRLTDAQVETAMQIGQKMAAEGAEKVQKTTQRFQALREQAAALNIPAEKTVSGKKGGVTIATQNGDIDGIKYSAVDESKLSQRQKNIITAVQGISEALGLDVTVISAQGNLGGAYNKGGHIYLNINSGMNLRGFSKAIAAGSFAHEMTHWLQEYAGEQYESLKNIITKSMSADQLDKLVQEQLRTQPDLTPDGALDEVIANACQPLLENSKAFEELARQDMTLAQKILDFLKEFAQKFKDAFAEIDYKDNLPIFEAVKAVEGHLDEMQAAFDKAMLAARENMAAERAVNENTAFVQEAAAENGVSEETQKQIMEGAEEFMTDPENQAQIGPIDLRNYEGAVGPDGKPLFQVFAFEHDEPEYRAMLEKAGLEGVDIDRLFDTVDAAMEKIMANLEVLDYAWERDIDDRVLKTVKPNSDHLYKVSIDFSTLCRKRIMQGLVQYQLQAALDRALTQEEGIAIRDALVELQKQGLQIEVACALCYVESARMKSPEQIKKFLANREQVIREYFAGKSKTFRNEAMRQAEQDERQKIYEEMGLVRGKGIDDNMYDVRDAKAAPLNKLPVTLKQRIQNAKKAAKASFAVSAEQQKIIDTAGELTISDFTTPEGLENLARNHREIYDAYTSYVRNATKSKGIENDVWWRAGDSMESISDTLIANMNAENGLRTQSWSDFQVIHMMDYIAQTIELATRHAKQHAYTKVIDYVDLMGQTGVMINMSLIPAAEYDGTLKFDDVEGIVSKEAFQMRDKYHVTAGTIAIGINNNQIRQLLASALIDYVIPYHHSGMSKAVRLAMHIPGWDSYQDYQNEKKLSRSDAERNARRYGVDLLPANDPNYHKAPAFSEWFDLKEAQRVVRVAGKEGRYGVMTGGYRAMQEAAERYKQMCAERGIEPKFSYGAGDFSTDDNYWKLLIDRKMVDNVTGDIIEQKALKPIFDLGVINRILDDELARYGQVKQDQDEAIRRVSEAFLSGKVQGGMSLSQIAEAMQNPVDNVTNVASTLSKGSPDIRFQLMAVDPVQPSSGSWQRTHTTEQAMQAYPNLWNVAAEESEKRNPTQIASTQGTYRKIYNILKNEGFSGRILDASSGLGLGTKVGREEFGFDVDDIEPYPDKDYHPKYTDYSTLYGQYDAIISSAVLNVLPQDQRDALAVKMGELLAPGGKLFITTRGNDVENLANTGKNIHLGPMEWIETVKGSYQKGFTQNELKAYLEDALGDGFTVELSNKSNGGKFNNNTSIVVTKTAGSQISYSQQQVLTNAVSQAINDKGDTRKKKKPVPVFSVSRATSGMVLAASGGQIDIYGKEVALYLDDVWHEYRKHSNLNDEKSQNQVAMTQQDIEDAIEALNNPDMVECLFSSVANPTQKKAFAYAKKTSAGHYVVIEAVGGNYTPYVFPVEIIQFTQDKWNEWIGQGITLGEMLYKDDPKKLAALDVAANKKNRVTAARYAHQNGSASSAASSVNNTIAQPPAKSKTQKQVWNEGDVYNDRALVSEETLDKWMSSKWYGSSNPADKEKGL